MPIRKTTTTALLVASLAFWGAGQAHAADGVIEINQAAADAGSVTPGDGAGLPVTISEPGSYKLTGNITVPGANTAAIIITASDVTLDLGGFTIAGPRIDGTGDGIGASSLLQNIEVRNGTVEGMGRIGIGLAGSNNRVVDVRTRRNRLYGIQTGSRGLVRDCTSNFNGSNGILTSADSSLIGNLSTQNGFNNPSASGLSVGNGGTVLDNVSSNNAGEGVVTGRGATVIGNTFTENGEDGARVGEGSLLKDNTVRDNGGFGLNLGDDSGYAGNVITDNTSGTVDGGLEIGTNLCKDDTVCP